MGRGRQSLVKEGDAIGPPDPLLQPATCPTSLSSLRSRAAWPSSAEKLQWWQGVIMIVRVLEFR